MLFITVASARHSRADEPLVWGFADFPPYIEAKANGQPYGSLAEMVQNIFQHADIDYLPLHTPNKRIRKLISEGFVGFSIGPLTAIDNPDDFYMSKAAVAKIETRSYWIGEQNPVMQATDFYGQSVVLITSYQYSGLRDYLENPNNKVSIAANVEDHKRALTALLLKRATYMLGYSKPTELIQLQMNVENLHSFPLNEIKMYFYIHKSIKNSRQVMDRLDKSHAELYPNHVRDINKE
jgi:polar amino acid transport system substrate-binding protein